MKQFLNALVLGSLVVSSMPVVAQEATIDDVSKEATRLEAELGKYRDTAPEAGDALFALTELYHSTGRSFGLVRSAHRFTAAHGTDPRHAQVMLRLIDGLESLSRHKKCSVQARQFLTRYPKAPQCPDVEARLAYTLEKMAEKERAALTYRDRWNRESNVNGRNFGVSAVRLFAEAGGKSITEGATLAEEMFDKLPKDEFAKHIGLRSYYEWRRIRPAEGRRATPGSFADDGGKLRPSGSVLQRRRDAQAGESDSRRSVGSLLPDPADV